MESAINKAVFDVSDVELPCELWYFISPRFHLFSLPFILLTAIERLLLAPLSKEWMDGKRLSRH